MDRLRGKIGENAASPRDLSLYFHLPFCQTLCWYCGCNTVITTDTSVSGKYIDYLAKEMDLLAGDLNPSRQVTQLHFGGGTPTFLNADELRRLGGLIRERFNFAEGIEAGVEIDPRRLNNEQVTVLRSIVTFSIANFDSGVGRMRSSRIFCAGLIHGTRAKL